MAELPFVPMTETLRDLLRHDYIRPVGRWLLGKSESGVLAQEGNSHWEAALTIKFLFEARQMFLEHDEEPSFCEMIPTRCCMVSRWLLDKSTNVSQNMICWDGGTWDTSVVVRALVLCLVTWPQGFSDTEAARIVQGSVKALRWLEMRFSQWEHAVKYPFGPADVAQMLITSIYVRETLRDLPGPDAGSLNLPLGPDVMKQIVDYLLHIKTVERPPGVSIEDESLDYAWWGDFFQTAEVLEALAQYYRYCSATGSGNQETLRAIENTAVQVYRFLEYSQVESMWGTHVDTIRTVYSYISVSTMLPIVSPEPHILFKALRWICDEKQRFPDGSFLHTLFLTIFMVDSLVQVHNNWGAAKRSVGEIYDDCLWAAPTGTSHERTARYAAELECLELTRSLADYRERVQNLVEQRKRRRYSAGLTVLALMVVAAAGSILDVAEMAFKFTVKDVGDFLKLLGVTVSFYCAGLAFIWRR